MKITLINKKEEAKEIKYPCLMISNDNQIVVLFDRHGSGYVVYSERQKQPFGYYSYSWVMPSFELFKGTIELTND